MNIDPCMGSGHILVYAFDALMQIYESQGYTHRDAAQAIIENNLYGLDIDDRAYQLSYFAVTMKARKFDRRFLTRGIAPKFYSIQESNNIQKSHLQFFGNSFNEIEKNTANQQMKYLLELYHDAKEYGSILNVDICDWELLNRFIDDCKIEVQVSFDSIGIEVAQGKMKEIISIAKVMSGKYDVVVTNPPYMGSNGMGNKLSDYVKKYFPDSRSDFFSIFIEKCALYTKPNGYYSMITQPSFLFLSSFEKLRSKIINFSTISSLLHMGRGIFGIDFGSTAFVIKKKYFHGYKGCYFRLHERTFQYIDSDDISKLYLVSRGNKNFKYNFSEYNTKYDINVFEEVDEGDGGKELQIYYETNQNNFSKIPSSPIAYWVSKEFIETFDNKTIAKIAKPRQGLATGCNELFIRLWFEVNEYRVFYNAKSLEEANMTGKKWFPYNKGGEFRKWYGNNDYIVNWENDGLLIRNFKNEQGKLRSRPQNTQFYFKECISWSLISSGSIAFRYKPYGYIFDVAGMSCFSSQYLKYLLALCNSPVSNSVLKALAPTINYQVGDIGNIPVIFDSRNKVIIEKLVQRNIQISKDDWDSFEISWDFQTHPLIKSRMIEDNAWSSIKYTCKISSMFKVWELFTENQFTELKSNEEGLNRIFIEIYGLQDELYPEVEDKDITVRKADLQRDIKSFMSYAVGCMVGRYSLDVDGLAYVGGEWDDSKYITFIPDKDNCILITDEEYFEDDIGCLFVAFVKKVYGIETLEENLDFIAKALGNKGDTSREIIRNYFVKDFIKDHIKIYQKRPIYWLCDSGKQDGFKALIYMHRYNADTTGVVRVDYLHKMQKIYMGEIDRMKDMVENSNQAREIAQAEKRKEKLIKQLKETKEYDEKIAHIALSRIDIDLDDGVKFNYEKVQTGQDGKKLDILAKI